MISNLGRTNLKCMIDKIVVVSNKVAIEMVTEIEAKLSAHFKFHPGPSPQHLHQHGGASNSAGMGYRDNGANTNPYQASNNSQADSTGHLGEGQTSWTTGTGTGSDTKDKRERTSLPIRRYGGYSKIDSGSKSKHS